MDTFDYFDAYERWWWWFALGPSWPQPFCSGKFMQQFAASRSLVPTVEFPFSLFPLVLSEILKFLAFTKWDSCLKVRVSLCKSLQLAGPRTPVDAQEGQWAMLTCWLSILTSQSMSILPMRQQISLRFWRLGGREFLHAISWASSSLGNCWSCRISGQGGLSRS